MASKVNVLIKFIGQFYQMRIIILSRNGELYSTRSLYNAVRRKNHFVRVIDHMNCDLKLSNDENCVFFEGHSLKGYDAIIPRIGYTVTHYGAAVIRQFESMGVFTTLRAQALLNARDKLSCLQLLSARGIKVPASIASNSAYGLLQLASELKDFPKILKVLSGTHGSGVIKIDQRDVLETMVETFIGIRQRILLQDFIREASGEDLRVLVVDGRVVASMIRKAPPGEFRSNLHRGGIGVKAELTSEEEEIAIESARIMGLKVAGVDMLRSHEGPLVLEVNASPGLEGIETITQVDVASKIIEFIERKYKRR